MDGTTLHNRMTLDEYRAERARLGKDRKDAGDRWEQDLARLFDRSGLTQEALAKEEGKDQAWVARCLLLGRFLNFMSTDINAENVPTSLTLRKFRDFWKKTDKADNERKRFLDVAAAIQSALLAAPRRPQIGTAIRERFADGKWHSPAEIAETLDAEPDHVLATLQSIADNETYRMRGERKRAPKGETHFRLFKQEKMISTAEIKEKLAPLIKGLKEEGKKNMATMSPGTVARLAALLQRHLDEWSE